MQNGQFLPIMPCMSKVIFRIQKLKSAVSIRRSLKHAFREQETPNADGERANLNKHVGAKSGNEAMMKIRQRWPEKRRKDAVLAIEHLLTASPEWFKGKTLKEQNKFFNDGLKYLRRKYGSKNVIYSGIHRDEKTPHMYAYVVPLDESSGRLNAKKWVGGSKALTQMQDEIAEIAEPYGLQRGDRKSKARHKEIRTWYAEQKVAEAVASKTKKLKLTAKDRLVLASGKTPAVIKEFNEQLQAFELVQQQMNNQLAGAESARIRCEMATKKAIEREIQSAKIEKAHTKILTEEQKKQEDLEKRLQGAIKKESELLEKLEELKLQKQQFEDENDQLLEELQQYESDNFKPL